MYVWALRKEDFPRMSTPHLKRCRTNALKLATQIEEFVGWPSLSESFRASAAQMQAELDRRGRLKRVA
jgi:hypothetical protein